MHVLDLDPLTDLKAPVPPGLTLDEEVRWRCQRYIKDYPLVRLQREVGDESAS